MTRLATDVAVSSPKSEKTTIGQSINQHINQCVVCRPRRSRRSCRPRRSRRPRRPRRHFRPCRPRRPCGSQGMYYYMLIGAHSAALPSVLVIVVLVVPSSRVILSDTHAATLARGIRQPHVGILSAGRCMCLDGNHSH